MVLVGVSGAVFMLGAFGLLFWWYRYVGVAGLDGGLWGPSLAGYRGT